MKSIPALLLGASLALLSCGCENAEPPQDPASGNPAQGTATIEGKIRFEGEIPRMPLIDMSKEPDCQAQSEEERRARTVRVQNGVLLDVIVWVEGDAIVVHQDERAVARDRLGDIVVGKLPLVVPGAVVDADRAREREFTLQATEQERGVLR